MSDISFNKLLAPFDKTLWADTDVSSRRLEEFLGIPSFITQFQELQISGNTNHWYTLERSDFRDAKTSVRELLEPESEEARFVSALLWPDWGGLLAAGMFALSLRYGNLDDDDRFITILDSLRSYLGSPNLRIPYDALLYDELEIPSSFEVWSESITKINRPAHVSEYRLACQRFLGADELTIPWQEHSGHWLNVFIPDFYLRQLLHFAFCEKGMLTEFPLQHYLFIGIPSLLRPNPLFCPAMLAEDGKHPIDGFVSFHLTLSTDSTPSPLFDAFYFLQHYSVVTIVGDPLYNSSQSVYEYFCRKRLPSSDFISPYFDPVYYSTQISREIEKSPGEFKGAGRLAWHYLHWGALSNIDPNPAFDSAWYLSEYPTVREEMRRLRLVSAFEHFLIIGKRLGMRPSPPLIDEVPTDRSAKSIFERRVRRGAESFEKMGANFKLNGPADMSIVVPVCGAYPFTASFLRQAYFAKNYAWSEARINVEVIVVSNGSTDLTNDRLRDVPGILLLEEPNAIGFPAAVNRGVERSSGKTLIIVNNDILFEPDMFLRLAARLDDDDEIGLVGCSIILPNQRLQEVGSVVFRDGSGFGIAREEDPWTNFTTSLMDVDYCSGCAVAIKRATFDEFEGLDEIYSPGYYEETDLCFRLRSAGKRVLVDGSIQIEHYEHGSFGSGVPVAVVAVQMAKNREIFRRRHAAALRCKPWRKDVATGRDLNLRLLDSKRVLFIEDSLPSRELGSGFPRARAITELISKMNIDVEFGAFFPTRFDGKFGAITDRLIKDWTKKSGLKGHIRENPFRYTHLYICRLHNLKKLSGDIRVARSVNPALQVICDTEALGFLRDVENAAQSENFDLAQLVGDPNNPIQAVVDREIVPFLDLVDHWVAVSNREKNLLSHAGCDQVSVLGHFDAHLNTQSPRDLSFSRPRSVLLFGAAHEINAPNYEAAVWFIKNCLDKLAVSLSGDIKLIIAGNWSDEAIRALRHDCPTSADRVDFRGFVPEADVESLYLEAGVVVAPTLRAAGLPYKLYDAFLHQVPVVMSEILLRQLEDEGDEKLTGLRSFNRDEPNCLIDIIVELLGEEAAADHALRAQADFLSKQDSIEQAEKTINNILI